MTKQCFVPFLLVAFVLFGLSSCQKDKINDEFTNETFENAARLGDQELARRMDETQTEVQEMFGCNFDGANEVGYPSIEKLYGNLNDIDIAYQDRNGKISLLYPLVKDGTLENFLLINPSEEAYFLLKTARELNEKDIEGRNISPFVTNLYKIQSNLTKDLKVSGISEAIGKYYDVQAEKNRLLLVEKKNIEESGEGMAAPGFIDDSCLDYIPLMVDQYLDFFNLSNQSGNTNLTLIMEQALIESQPSSFNGILYCVCPSLNLVLENLIPNITDSSLQEDLVDLYISETGNPGGSALGFPLCQSTFNNYTTTGSGASINLECIRLTSHYVTIDFPFDYEEVCYEFPNWCIATGQFEIVDGIIDPNPIGNNTRKFHSKEAYIYASEQLNNENAFRYLTGLPFLTDTEAASLFKNEFESKLSNHLTGVAVSTGSCSGSIGVGIPEYNFFGFCTTTSCTCD